VVVGRRTGAGLVLDLALSYDALGRLTEKRENGVTTTYSYDVRGHLARVLRNGAVVAAYSYDANGNRSDAGRTADARDRITARTGATYAYDAKGQRTTKTEGAIVTRYAYDGRGHLASAEVVGTVRVDYDLDAYGRRVTKRRNGTVENRYLYRNQLQPAAEVDAAGNVLTRYVYARGELAPDLMERAGASYALLKDERGSIRFVVDVFSGVVAQALEYDPFGKVTSDTNPGFQPFAFAGGLYDPDTGLTHFGAREYDAETGSFTRPDPSGFAAGENRYAYAGGDPVNFVDPDGNFIQAVIIGAAVAGAEGALENYVAEGVGQALDPDQAGFDCAAMRAAAKQGAVAGAIAGGISGGASAMAGGGGGGSAREPGSGTHRWGTEKARPRAEPYSKWTQTTGDGSKGVQNTVYDGNGLAAGQVDFKPHGAGAPSGHGHILNPPGQFNIGHGNGAVHLDPSAVPKLWSGLPPGMPPAK
jgi:RHS repeat-associated protein